MNSKICKIRLLNKTIIRVIKLTQLSTPDHRSEIMMVVLQIRKFIISNSEIIQRVLNCLIRSRKITLKQWKKGRRARKIVKISQMLTQLIRQLLTSSCKWHRLLKMISNPTRHERLHSSDFCSFVKLKKPWSNKICKSHSWIKKAARLCQHGWCHFLIIHFPMVKL